MPRVFCRACGFKTKLTERELERGMLCPNCSGGNLRAQFGRKTGKITAGAVRFLIGGPMLLVAGWFLWQYGNSHWNDGRFGARMIGAGIGLMIFGAIGVVAGLYTFIRDLMT